MRLWERLAALDTAAAGAYREIQKYRLDQLESPEILAEVGARSVFGQKSGGRSSFALVGREWEKIRADQQPPRAILWTRLAEPFRALLDETFLAAVKPAYYALLLDFKAALYKAADPRSFSFAVFDAKPREATKVIDTYLADGISTSYVLYDLPLNLRQPIVVEWRRKGTEPSGQTPFWPEEKSYLLAFRSGPTVKTLEWDKPPHENIHKMLKDHALRRPAGGVPVLDYEQRILDLYRVTIRGYRKHVQHYRAKFGLLGPCTKFVGVFIPMSAAEDSKAAAFFLFDRTSRSGKAPTLDEDLARRAVFLARCVESSLNNWQRLKSQEEEGERAQRRSFAHHTSAVIDSIAASVKRLPEKVKDGMGGALLAKLHLMRAEINSYRSEASPVNARAFPYPWHGANPFSVYRDIGIQLGLARAEAAPDHELDVRKAGRAALRSENQPDQPGFDNYRRLFSKLPTVGKSWITEVQHSSFAVLFLLALKQAVYHTIRARLGRNPSASISITVREAPNGLGLECTISNADVDPNKGRVSKDVRELKDMAARLSAVPGHRRTYSVEGPSFDGGTGAWHTTIRIDRQKKGGAVGDDRS